MIIEGINRPQAVFYMTQQYVEPGLDAINQAMLALERDTEIAEKNYLYKDVLRCFKVR
jgi:hypothetical protein